MISHLEHDREALIAVRLHLDRYLENEVRMRR
jgi:hypothetical protein